MISRRSANDLGSLQLDLRSDPGEGDSRMQRLGRMAPIRSAALNILRANSGSVRNVSQALYANTLKRDRLFAFGV